MKPINYFSLVTALLLMITFTTAGAAGTGKGAAAEKATGDVVVFNIDFPARLHWFGFAAHELADEPFGKGFIDHQRLSQDGMEILREEYSEVTYVIVDGNDAWFAGPIVYDSLDSNPTRWFVLHVYDGGKPKDQSDWMWFTRVDSEGEAFDLVESMASPGSTHEVESGNLMIH